MQVLVVDDQYAVVEGVIAGVNWEKLGITRVFPAYSVDDAKAVLRDNTIQILLCDIEMPPKNGFDLLRWVQGEKIPLACIFLSSHAEFEYAREAVKLSSFDYILQPARYEDIEAALLRAIQKIEEDRQVEEYYRYGLYWQQREGIMLDSFLSAFLSGNSGDPTQLLEELGNLKVPLCLDSRVCPILFQFVRGGTGEEFRQLLNTRLVEALHRPPERTLLSQLETGNYLCLLFGGENEWSELVQSLKGMLNGVKEETGGEAACYLGDIVSMESLHREYHLLARRRRDNVAGYMEVFAPSQKQRIAGYVYSFPNMENWASRLLNGETRVVREEATRYLERQKRLGVLTAELLAKFHQDFIQMFFTAAKSYEEKTHDIFYEQYPFADFLEAYTSYDKMIALIDFAIGYVEGKIGGNSGGSPVERAIAYIHKNIEKDLSRTEIAEAIFLNPEYLSRLFKKETGVSLSDFILAEKMEIAKALLTDTNIPVSLVASKIGYSNFSYFSQVFKKITGKSPGEYRQKEK